MSYQINSENYRKEIRSFAVDFLKAEHVNAYTCSKQVEAYASNWCLGIAKIPEGLCKVRSGEQWISIENEIAIFIPPFSILEFNISIQCEIKWISIMSTVSLPLKYERTPYLWQGSIKIPSNKDETFDAIEYTIKNGIKLNHVQHSCFIAEKAKAHMDKNFRENLKIKDIAEALQVSRVVMSRSFSENYGLTLTEYRHRLRLFEALSYLNKGYSITDALVMVGFADSSQFNFHFKKYFKIPPHKYAFFKQKENKFYEQDLSGL